MWLLIFGYFRIWLIMDGGKKALVPHPTEGFKLGHIVDIGSDTVTVELCDVPGSVCMQ